MRKGNEESATMLVLHSLPPAVSLYNKNVTNRRKWTLQRLSKYAIVIFWLIMVGLLIQRNIQGPDSQAPPLTLVAPLSLQAQDEWMGVYHQNQKIGYLQRRLTPTNEGYQWEELWRMRMQFFHTPQTIHTEIRATTDKAFALTHFEFRLLSSGMTFRASGEVADHKLQGQMTTGGETTPFSFPLQVPIYLPATTEMTLRQAKLQTGEERHFSIFNPLSMRTETVTIAVLGPEKVTIKGEQLGATKVTETLGETTTQAWLDREGKVIKEEAALGMVLLRETQQEALGAGWQKGASLDLVAFAAIPVPQPLPNPRTLTSLRLRFASPVDSLQFSFPPRQQQHEHTLTITQEAASILTSYTLPQSDVTLASDLVSTPFLQSTHPRIVTQMQQILGDERDARQATQQLLDWTYTSIEKIPTVGLPTALEVLNSKRGDCNEHAVLFTALARAAGIPARVAAGIVYLDGAFYYHAWSEVWLGQWVAVDPTFHQFPADATHVKFVEGGPEQHVALLKVIGQISLEILDYKN